MNYTIVPEQITIDTNILIYAIDVSEGEKHLISARVVSALSRQRGLLPLQAVNEFFFVCSRKSRLPTDEAEKFAAALLRRCKILLPDPLDTISAMRMAQTANLQFFDALLIATAQRGKCSVLLTEDMQDGLMLDGLKIVNPFRIASQELSVLLS